MSLELDEAPAAQISSYNCSNTPNFPKSPSDKGIAGVSISPKSSGVHADDAEDTIITPPVTDERMFYGLLGQFAKQSAMGTEVHPVASMAAMMSYLSACMGRNPMLSVGDGWHHLRLYTFHVGRSSKGGKGMALDLLKRIDTAIRKASPSLVPQIHNGGLSSREGVAFLIHDGFKHGKDETPPIADKRLFVIEHEFANVLAQIKRDGNTLSACLRDCWDGGSIQPATKNSPIWATDPHIALHACITPNEVRARMSRGELTNGFANRFLIIWAERTGVIPFPARATDEVVQSFADAFAKVINFGLSGYPAQTETMILSLTSDAKKAFGTAYREFAKRHPGGELIAGLLERRAPMLLRIAGLFAITDCVHEITADHIEAAKAWMDYYSASVHVIFAPATDVAEERSRKNRADKLLAWLTSAGDWCSRTNINCDCFKKSVHKTHINAVIEMLLLDNRIERREVDTGAPVKRTEYRVKIKSTESSGASQTLKLPVVIESS